MTRSTRASSCARLAERASGRGALRTTTQNVGSSSGGARTDRHGGIRRSSVEPRVTEARRSGDRADFGEGVDEGFGLLDVWGVGGVVDDAQWPSVTGGRSFADGEWNHPVVAAP